MKLTKIPAILAQIPGVTVQDGSKANWLVICPDQIYSHVAEAVRAIYGERGWNSCAYNSTDSGLSLLCAMPDC